MTVEPPTPHGPLVALLAAGSARRFGEGKLDALLGGRALGAWALASAQDCGFDVAVVIGPKPPSFALEAQAMVGVRVIENPHAADGMGTSVACAARAAIASGHAGLIILLADMPFVEGGALQGLIDPERAVFARHADGNPGPPACIPARLLPRLCNLTDERGARSVLDAADIRLVDWPPDQLFDIDTPAALAVAQAMLAGATTDTLPDHPLGIG